MMRLGLLFYENANELITRSKNFYIIRFRVDNCMKIQILKMFIRKTTNRGVRTNAAIKKKPDIISRLSTAKISAVSVLCK